MFFDGIKGQENAVHLLKKALQSGRLPTAYLFTGPAGCGRMPAAISVAASFNCETAPLACGLCGSCRLHNAGTHPDLTILRPLEGKRWILIEQVRDLIEKAYLMPMQGQVSTFIIDDAHAMNPNSANAFLKTLEEPPRTSRFILIAPDRNSVLPTISSRCQNLAFRPLGRKIIEGLLQLKGIDGKRAALLASMARGSMESALDYHREEIIERLADEFEPLLSPERADSNQLLDLANRWGRNRVNALKILEFMAQWYRDMLIIAEDGFEDQIIHTAHLPALRSGASQLGGYRLSMVLESIEDTRDDLEHNTNVELSLDNLLFKIRKFGKMTENRI